MSSAASAIVRCVIYLRISLDRNGDGLAVDRQRAECQRIARERGWVIVREYVDASVSAFKKRVKRPEYEQMISAYRSGQFDAVICYDLDRLTRQPRQLEDWIDLAEGRGLKLVTANGEADLTTDGGRMYARIKAAVARGESERKAARQVSAARQRAEMGRMPAGNRAFGFDNAGCPLEAPSWCEVATRKESGEAGAVREVFVRFHAGDSVAGISRWLNGTGAPTVRGGPWTASTVREILVNPRYKGVVVYRRQKDKEAAPEYPGTFGALVDEVTWDAVNGRLADPRRKTAFGTDRKHLGSSLYECGVCSRLVRSTSAPGRYRCPDGHVTRTAAPVDELVLRVVRARLARPDIGAVAAAEAGGEAEAASAAIAALQGRLKQTERDYDADLIDGHRYKEKRSRLEAEIALAEAQRIRLTAGSEVGGVLGAPDPVAAFDSVPLGAQQSVIRFLYTVELEHVGRGKRGFDPATVRMTPKRRRTPARPGRALLSFA